MVAVPRTTGIIPEQYKLGIFMAIGKKYQEQKKVVIDIFEKYKDNRGSEDDGVDLNVLESKIKALKDAKFTLAVVGETKAGKSTLINALLGEKILPTDLLQSSSAIVEIFQSATKQLKVMFADGHEDTIVNNDIDKRLRELGSLDDNFRDISTSAIDNYIVNGRISLEINGARIKDNDLNKIIDLNLIQSLKKDSGIDHQGKDKKIIEYINTKTKANIPVKISLGYPLSYNFTEMRIVDTPGVNAVGGVQHSTYEYIKEVNAILFVHSLENAIETSSFSDFVNEHATNRTKETLFLILTKSGSKSKIEIGEKLNDAKNRFREYFSEDRIIHVDAMLKIMCGEANNFESPDALAKHYKQKRERTQEQYDKTKNIESRDENIIYDAKCKLLNNILGDLKDSGIHPIDNETLNYKLNELSNFEKLEENIEEFTQRAPANWFIPILQSIRTGYQSIIDQSSQKITLLKCKKKHPQSLETEISRIKRISEEYKKNINSKTQEIEKNYTGTNAIYRPKLQKIKSEYQQRLQTKRKSTTDKDQFYNMAVQLSGDITDEVNSLMIGVQDSVKSEINDFLETNAMELEKKSAIHVPKIDVHSIKLKATEAATISVDDNEGMFTKKRLRNGLVTASTLVGFRYATGIIFGPAGIAIATAITAGATMLKPKPNAPVFEPEKFMDEILKNLEYEFSNLTDNIAYNLLTTNVKEYLESFRDAKDTRISEYKKEINKLLLSKQDNEQIMQNIVQEEDKIKIIKMSLGRTDELLAELRK